MHLHKFADMVAFSEIAIGGAITKTEAYRSFFKNLHPAQLLNSTVRIPVYEVVFSYYTARNNYRKARKYVFLHSEHEDLDMEIQMMLDDWVIDNNKWKPYRKISNVQILEINPIAYADILVGF